MIPMIANSLVLSVNVAKRINAPSLNMNAPTPVMHSKPIPMQVNVNGLLTLHAEPLYIKQTALATIPKAPATTPSVNNHQYFLTTPTLIYTY
jgi:hypothetical protein